MNTAYVTLLDDNYITGALLTINSLCKHIEKNSKILILYWNNIDKKNKDLILKLNSNIKFKKIKTLDYPTAKFDPNYRNWGYNCHYRYDIFDLTEYDSLIYFDCDIIFNTPIDIAQITSNFFGAVSRKPGTIVQINERIGFDAGLLLIGKKFLNHETKLKLLDLCTQPAPKDRFVKSQTWVGNEPVLNTYFCNFNMLSEQYNLCTDSITTKNIDQPANIQFIGHKKPWNGEKLEDQFDRYIFDSIARCNGQYSVSILLRKIIKIYNNEKEQAQDKLKILI